MKKSKLFYEIPKNKLTQIYELLKNENGIIGEGEIEGVYQTFYEQMVVKFDKSKLENDELQTVIENYKCVHNDLSNENKVENISKSEIQKGKIISYL